MTQPIYRSTDASAPTLGNNNGDLLSVLDAILANGYGSKSPLGWSIAFTATNKRVYQMGDGGSNPSSGMQLRVDDSGNVYEAKVRGAESFSDIDTIGSGGFPTEAQQANGLFWQKTNNTAGNRAWIAIGDDRRFFMMVDVTGAGVFNTMWFGDPFSFKSGDLYNCLLIGKAGSVTNQNGDPVGALAQNVSIAATNSHYMPRSYTGVGSAIAVNKIAADGRHASTTQSGSMGDGTYPDPITGTLNLSRFYVVEPTPKAVRGYLPGIWVVMHAIGSMSGVANGDTFNGADGLASRTFELRTATINNIAGAFAIETSDWPESF